MCGTESSSLQITWSSWWPAPHRLSSGPDLSHLFSINSDMIKRALLWMKKASLFISGNSKCLGNTVPRMGAKTKYISYCTLHTLLGCKVGGSYNPIPFWFNNWLEWLTELRKTLFLQLLICYEGYHSEIAKWKRGIEQGMGVGHMKRPCPFLASYFFSTLMCSST